MLLGLAALVAACSPTTVEQDRPQVAFVLVGDRDDLGYNQAVWEGYEGVARAFPDIDVIAVEHVGEHAAADIAMRRLVDGGADVIFATSFGHGPMAYRVARDHPGVVVVHQGGVEPSPALPNFGTYFGSHAELLFAAGVMAGTATESGRIGFVGAFPIPATYNNVNALLLGAREVRPDASVELVLTGSWCERAAQARAADQLLQRGVDVLAQHQDCTATILQRAETAGVAAIGYHSDGSEAAPDAWLTGAIWAWEQTYIDIVDTVLDGRFRASPYDGDWRAGLADDGSPLALAEPGGRVAEATRARVQHLLSALRTGERTVFDGPLRDADGRMRVPDGQVLAQHEIDAMDYVLEGVTVVDGDDPEDSGL